MMFYAILSFVWISSFSNPYVIDIFVYVNLNYCSSDNFVIMKLINNENNFLKIMNERFSSPIPLSSPILVQIKFCNQQILQITTIANSSDIIRLERV